MEAQLYEINPVTNYAPEPALGSPSKWESTDLVKRKLAIETGRVPTIALLKETAYDIWQHYNFSNEGELKAKLWLKRQLNIMSECLTEYTKRNKGA